MKLKNLHNKINRKKKVMEKMKIMQIKKYLLGKVSDKFNLISSKLKNISHSEFLKMIFEQINNLNLIIVLLPTRWI